MIKNVSGLNSGFPGAKSENWHVNVNLLNDSFTEIPELLSNSNFLIHDVQGGQGQVMREKRVWAVFPGPMGPN